jgi:hypothetical protein
MLALLSGFIGFLSSMAPEVINMVRDRADKKHELEVMQKQAELGLEQAKAEQGKAEVDADARAREAASRTAIAELRLADKSIIAAYSASVRPTITYAFFLLYVALKVKLAVYFMTVTGGTALPWNVDAAFLKVWTEEDMMLFAWIIGYWFGERQIRKRT